MGVMRRQQKQVSLRLSSPSVDDVVATIRARQGQVRRYTLRVKVSDEGRLIARIPGGRYSSPPCVKGGFEPGDDGVAFEGVIVESYANVALPRGFNGMGALFAVVAILLAVAGNPAPGSYICGVCAVLFGLTGYGLGRFRASSFSYDCKELMRELTPLLPGARQLT